MEKFIEYAKKIKPTFTVNQDNEPAIKALLASEKKGVLIIGGVGTGKTCLMKIFCDYHAQIYTTRIMCADVREICFDFMVKGYAGIEKYYRDETDTNCYRHPRICLDDLGIENPLINYYGTQEDIISNILYLRHSRRIKTYATTNLNIESLQKRYGDRLFDRFNEMFDIVYLTGESRR